MRSVSKRESRAAKQGGKAIGKELERIEKEHRNIERMLEKIEAAETVQTATDETEEKK